MTESRAHRTVLPTDAAPSAQAHAEKTVALGLSPNDPFISFAFAVLDRHVAELTANRPLDRIAPTPDQIHQLRVAARRLRVALRLFRHMLPTAAVRHLRAELRSFAASLGELRDLDVYTQNLKAYVASMPPDQRGELTEYELYLRRERSAARRMAKAVLEAPRTAELFESLQRFVTAGPTSGALRRWRSLTVRDAVRAGVKRSARRVRRLGNELVHGARAAQLHELRIRAKRLRYELEFFAEVYPALKLWAKECKALQDLLGTLQDSSAATARLRRYATSRHAPGTGPTPLSPALAELRRSQLALGRSARRSFAECWPGFVANLTALQAAIP